MSESVEVILELGEKKVAIDLPENVAGELLRQGVSDHQAAMSETRGNIQNVNNIVRSYAARSFGQLDTIESRANSGVMATPIASPTTQAAPAGP